MGSGFKRGLKVGVVFGMLFLVFVFANNTSWGLAARTGTPLVFSHRGVSQQFQNDGTAARGCEAARMMPPAHPYIENTIPSIAAAFRAGADVVEFDVQRTGDDRWVVFHDRGLDCRTDGQGRVSEQTLEALQTLDVGYGYTEWVQFASTSQKVPALRLDW